MGRLRGREGVKEIHSPAQAYVLEGWERTQSNVLAKQRLSVLRPSRLTRAVRGSGGAATAPHVLATPRRCTGLIHRLLTTCGWPCCPHIARVLVLGDAGAARRAAEAAAHTYTSSGSPGTPCSRDCSINEHHRPRRGTQSWPIMIAGRLDSLPFDHLRLPLQCVISLVGHSRPSTVISLMDGVLLIC